MNHRGPVCLFQLEDAEPVLRFGWVSDGFEQIFGCTLAEAQRLGARHFHPDEEWPIAIERATRLRRGESLRGVARIRTAQGANVWVEYEMLPLATQRPGDGWHGVGYFREVLRATDGDPSLQGEAPQRPASGRWSYDLRTGELTCDADMHVLLEIDPAVGPIGNAALSRLITPAMRDFMTKRIAPDAAGQRPPALVTPLMSAAGTLVWVRAVQDEAGSKQVVSGHCTDITQQREFEALGLSPVIREREWIGRDVHDWLGQELTSLTLSLQGSLHDVARLVGQLKQESVRPPAIGAPLLDHVHAAAAPMTGHHEVRFEPLSAEAAQQVEALSDTVQQQICLIAREASNPALCGHHSSPVASLRVGGGQLLLRIEHQKAEWPIESSASALHLRSLRARAALIGAHIAFERGCVVEIALPLPVPLPMPKGVAAR